MGSTAIDCLFFRSDQYTWIDSQNVSKCLDQRSFYLSERRNFSEIIFCNNYWICNVRYAFDVDAFQSAENQGFMHDFEPSQLAEKTKNSELIFMSHFLKKENRVTQLSRRPPRWYLHRRYVYTKHWDLGREKEGKRLIRATTATCFFVSHKTLPFERSTSRPFPITYELKKERT